ncbi:MAG: putative lipid II flippase FtsW [Verrucomicrobiota bacterium]
MHRNAIYVLLFAAAGLTALGMVMLFSTSAFAQESHGDIYFFVKRQAMWLVIAVAAAIVAACVDYRWWKKTWWIFFAAAFVLLILCFVPGIGLRINGSNRWLHLGPMTFQPSEMAKLASLFFLAWWFDRFEKESTTLLKGLVFPLLILAALIIPIASEKDLGTSVLIVVAGLAVMYLAGTNIGWLAPLAILGLVGGVYAAMHMDDERMGRMIAFLNPERYKLSDGLQQWQGLIAFGSGGVEGLGLGEGRQKFLYLPYAHTDFIFPMIGEELGLRLTLLTVFGYLLICLCGTLVATNACDRFGMLLGFGCVMMITLQAVVNIGVTTSLLPNKGMPLPFISFGGSSLAVCYFMIGILVNIHRHGNPLVERVPNTLRRARNFCRL